MKITATYFTRRLLLKGSRLGTKIGGEYRLRAWRILLKVPRQLRYPLVAAFQSDDGQLVRCDVMIRDRKGEPHFVRVDVPSHFYESLPKVDLTVPDSLGNVLEAIGGVSTVEQPTIH